ncbi:MAG TPA: efflux RND transporter periplasmic adaptor subunit [Blastocatellia bacterium]|jgi:HlyD family secretion protein|nr:efflux RND transporter periplasmic adaptor subunit [Blastocatellia bacterium]
MKEKINRFALIIGQRRGLLITLALLSGVVIFAVLFWGGKADASDFLTAKVERGSVEVTVSATGTVQAVTTVQVGSQASGTIAWLGADFNSQVKRGQVIARLDPSTFQAQVENARASVTNAEAAVQAASSEITNQNANVQAAKANLEVARVQGQDATALVNRYSELRNVMAGRDIEAAQAQANVASGRVVQASAQVAQAEAARQTSRARLAQAQAQLAQAQAQLSQAQVNANNTVITSPIDGVVVSRSVDVGQTVAASLQAPTLFTIANDLTKMQVLASIDEADVGQIREGIKAHFTVDAFPGQTFGGQVSQVRLESQNLQNVVTYTAVVEVSNPEMKLRPGMTANITFPVEQRVDVLTVPNAALRFKPTLSEKEQEEMRAQMQARRQQRADERQGSAERQGPANEQKEAGDQPRASSESGARPQGQTVWVLIEGKKIEPRFVRTGLTNGRVTEIVGGNLQEGETVVTGQNESGEANKPQQAGSPFGRQPGGRSGGGAGGSRGGR